MCKKKQKKLDPRVRVYASKSLLPAACCCAAAHVPLHTHVGCWSQKQQEQITKIQLTRCDFLRDSGYSNFYFLRHLPHTFTISLLSTYHTLPPVCRPPTGLRRNVCPKLSGHLVPKACQKKWMGSSWWDEWFFLRFGCLPRCVVFEY